MPGADGRGAPVDRPPFVPGAWGYRPHLDGLRAVAVYLVVGFHAGVGRLSGGFVGVDVFFVLSGYLVTTILLVELDRTDGQVGFASFYARRVRRLLPAATVVLVVTAAAFPYLGSTIDVEQSRGDVQAAALYVSNWHFIREASTYFGPDVDASPVAHFWSLSVEEQFYLVWPVVLFGLYRVGRAFGARRRWVMRAGVAVGGAASLAWAVHLAGTDLDRAYFGTDTRAYQLLAGALLALSPGLASRLARRMSAVLLVAVPLAFGALLLVASDQIGLTPVNRGIAVTAVTVALLAGLEAAPGGLVARTLSWPLLVYLGKISYATYLWHWLVTMFLQRETQLSHIPTAVVVAAVASGLAALSHAVLETPVRTSALLTRFRYPVVVAGLTASVATAVVVVPALMHESRRAAPAAVEAAIDVTTAVPGANEISAAFYDQVEAADCTEEPVEACIRVSGSGPRVLLMGDSHAHMMVPAMVQLAEDHGFTLIDGARQGCPWQRDRYILSEEIKAVCRAVRPDTYDRVIRELDPDVIVLLNAQDPHTAYRGTESDIHSEETTVSSLEELRAPGRQVVLIEGIPRSLDAADLRTCLDGAVHAEQCRFRAAPGEHWIETLYRGLAEEHPDVVSIDIDPLVCPLYPVCDSVVDDVIIWRTEGHLTGTYVERIAPQLWERLVSAGVFDP